LRHQRAASLLERALERVVIPGHTVIQGWGWVPPGAHEEFIPDVMVAADNGDQVRFTGTPLLVVEVLSLNARDDLVVKAGKYARYGAPRFWVIDPMAPALRAYTLGADQAYHLVAQAHAGQHATLDTGAGTIVLDPADLVD
jgi:Uma2 family endonuclease